MADVPGVTKDRLSIKLNARTPDAPAALVIRGARQDGGGAEAMLRERRRGEFERRVPLPDDGARRFGCWGVRSGVCLGFVSPSSATKGAMRAGSLPPVRAEFDSCLACTRRMKAWPLAAPTTGRALQPALRASSHCCQMAASSLLRGA